MWDAAKALFELWRGDGEVPLGISGETGEEWNLETAVANYLKLTKARCHDPDEHFGPQAIWSHGCRCALCPS